MSKFKKVIESLKKGLTEQEKVEIAAAFDEAVEARAKIEVAAIMETKMNTVVNSVAKELQEKSASVLESLMSSVSEDVNEIEAQIDKYVQYFVKENLPSQLVETIKKGLRFAQYFESVEKGLREEVISEADKELAKQVATLSEELKVQKDKYAMLFERMVENSNQVKTETMKRKLFESISKYPDNLAEVMTKIAETSVDFARLTDDNVEETVTSIADSVKKAIKRRTKINEDSDTPTGKGKVNVPVQENDKSGGVSVDPEVAIYENVLDKFALQ